MDDKVIFYNGIYLGMGSGANIYIPVTRLTFTCEEKFIHFVTHISLIESSPLLETL